MTDLLRSMRLFVMLSEEGSFSALARRQNQSHTTIARAIDDLEVHFGVRLFQRSTRRLTLTGDGERLIEHAHMILDQVGQAEADLAGALVARGRVRIGVTTALGLHYAQKLPLLKEQHPDLLVELLFADWRDVADPSGLDMWLAVTGGEVESALESGDPTTWTHFPETMVSNVRLPDPLRFVAPAGELSMVTLGELQRVLVASPSYLHQYGMPNRASDLLQHQCLTYGYAAKPEPWLIDGHEWHVQGYLRANTSEAVLRSARAGLGIGLLPRHQVAHDIRSGDLVWLLPHLRISRLSIKAVHGFRGRRLPMRTRVALDFLQEHFPPLDKSV